MAPLMKEEGYIRLMRCLVLAGSLCLLIAFSVSWLGHARKREWQAIQKEFRSLEKDAVRGIQERDLPWFKRVDRCESCHLGLENPQLSAAALPHSAHPGNYLKDHPPQDFGCTVCHGGQGAALTFADAKGRAPSLHWSYPMLEQPWLQSSCGSCHMTLFSEPSLMVEGSGMEVLVHGRALFAGEGCLGCHRARGAGGIVGPDLTRQGEKTLHEYSFKGVRGEQTVSNWLKEHFRDPEMVSPGSRMLRVDLPESDLDALATFVMGLSKPEMPLDYFSLGVLEEYKGKRAALSGRDAFACLCAACHGKAGEGKDYEAFRVGVPAIGGRDFLRVASAEYIRFTLEKGRSLRQMATWAPELSGISDGELNQLVTYMKRRGLRADAATRGLASKGVASKGVASKGVASKGAAIMGAAPKGADPEGSTLQGSVLQGVAPGRAAATGGPEGAAVRGTALSGAQLYARYCATCHGVSGQGDVAVALSQPDFLHRADDDMLWRTLEDGRANTAMPGWSFLGGDSLTALIKHLRTWGNFRPDRSLPKAPVKPEFRAGERRFHFACSRCHGEFGEGETGPAIINRDFLASADDAFLFWTIARGRRHTAMFGWSSDLYNEESLSEKEVYELIAYMRTQAAKHASYIHAGANPGNRKAGELLYVQHCAQCHGDNAEGSRAPALNNQEFLSAASNGYLLATITLGREGSRMPDWGYESDSHTCLEGRQRQDLVAYLRSLARIQIRFTGREGD